MSTPKDQLKQIAIVVRGLVTSKKQTCFVDKILEEYQEYEGESLPFSKLGFKSAVKMLNATNEFIIKPHGNRHIIAARPNPLSSHIVGMVREQKSSSSKRLYAPPPSRKPASAFNVPNVKKNNVPDSLAVERENQRLREENKKFDQMRAALESLQLSHKVLCQEKQVLDNVMREQMEHQGRIITQEIDRRLHDRDQQYQQKLKQQENRLQIQNATIVGLKEELSEQKLILQNIASGPPSLNESEIWVNNNNNARKNNNITQNKTNADINNDVLTIDNKNKNIGQTLLSPTCSNDVEYRVTQGVGRVVRTSVQHRLPGKDEMEDFKRDAMVVEPQPYFPRKSVQDRLKVGKHHEEVNCSTIVRLEKELSEQKLILQNIASGPPSLNESAISVNKNNNARKNYNIASINSDVKPNNNQNKENIGQTLLPPTRPNDVEHRVTQGDGSVGCTSVQRRLRVTLPEKDEIEDTKRDATVVEPQPYFPRKTIQDRLKVGTHHEEVKCSTPGLNKKAVKSKDDMPIETETPAISTDPVRDLEIFCTYRGYTQSEYVYLYRVFRRQKGFQCQIDVNGYIYSTYPNDYPTKLAAQKSCALKALTDLQMKEARQNMPPCTFTEEELLDKIYAEVKDHSHGMFAKKVPNWFEDKFTQSIPDHWWTLVQASGKFESESTVNQDIILFAAKQSDINDVDTSNDSRLDGVDRVESFGHLNNLERSTTESLDKLVLPWSEPEWMINVTVCTSTNEVWARLMDPENISVFNRLQSILEYEIVPDIGKPLNVEENQPYIAQIADCMHRVTVIESNNEAELALCFFPDAGDTAWISFKDLFLCPFFIRNIPSLAVKFKLHGLEDFAGYNQASLALKHNLPDLTLTARICSNEADYLETGVVEVELFDKYENSNLGTMLELIQKHLSAPRLDYTFIKAAKVSHITTNGDLYLYIPDEKWQVDQIINQVIATKFDTDLSPNELKSNKLYLILDHTLSVPMKWHRGLLAKKYTDCPAATENELEMFYVDYGVTRIVPRSCIFELETLSKALSIIPYQAIKTRLHDIPPITEDIVARMRALLPENCNVLVQQNAVGIVPIITVYYRVPETQYSSNVNDTIRLEHLLKSSNGETTLVS